MKELKRLCGKLEKTGKDEAVRVALEALLLAPDDVDLQINVLGAAHQANWLSNRKKVFWRVFSIDSERWVSHCVARITATGNDANALCALLNSDVLTVATAVQEYSPHLALVWDVNGADFCGIGLAHHQGDQFSCYFYVGWKPRHDTVHRLDFIPRIEAPLGRGDQRLDTIVGSCAAPDGFWAELPYGFGYGAGRREFATPFTYLKPHGYTDTVRRRLGYEIQ